MNNDAIQVPLVIDLWAGDILVAKIEGDARLWNFVLGHAVNADAIAKANTPEPQFQEEGK